MLNSSRLKAALMGGAAILILSACGGGGGGSSSGGSQSTPPPPPPDTSAPVITFVSASDSIKAGQTQEFTASANDDRDGSVAVSISCDTGVVTGSTVIIPRSTEAGPVTCTASAVDAAGNRAEETLTFTVTPGVEASVFADINDAVPGEIILVSTENTILSGDPISGSFAGTTVNLISLGSDLVGFFVPPDAVSGERTLTFTLEDQEFEIPVNVTENATAISNPKEKIETYLSSGISDVDEIIENNSDGLSESQLDSLRNMRDDAKIAIDALSNATEAELQPLAIVLAANGFLNADEAAAKDVNYQAQSDFSLNLCRETKTDFVKSVVAAGGMNLVLAGGLVGLVIPGLQPIALGLVIGAAASLRGRISGATGVIGRASNVLEVCLKERFSDLVASLDVSGQTEFKITYREPNYPYSQAVEFSAMFEEEKSRLIRVLGEQDLDDLVKAEFQRGLASITQKLREIPITPPSLIESLVELQAPVFTPLTADELSVSSENSDVSAVIFDENDRTFISLDYTGDIDPAIQQVATRLIIQARDGGDANQPINATLTLAPALSDATVMVEQGFAVSSALNITAVDTVRATRQPQNGVLNLNEDGTFTYDPNGLFFGQDGFEVVGTKNGVDTEPAEITLDVIRVFEGRWQVAIDETVSDPDNLCGGTRSFRRSAEYIIVKESDVSYRTIVSGAPIRFTLASPDDPNGLSYSGQFTEPDGTLVDITIRAPGSKQLNGSSSYVYRQTITDGNGGTREGQCNGQTSFIGFRQRD